MSMAGMGRIGFVGMLLLTVALLGRDSASDETKAASRRLLGSLKVGQPVTVKDRGMVYEISTLDEVVPQTHTVHEIGDDYVLVRDIAGVTDVRIPVYAIKSITRLRTRLK